MIRYPAALSNKLIKNIETTELCDGLAIPIMAYRIKYLMVSLIRPDTETFEELEFTVNEFKEYFDMKTWGGNQQDALEYAISMLRGAKYKVGKDEITWLDPESDIDGDDIHLRLHDSLTTYLLGMKGYFTKICYENIKNLKSKYAFRLYELLSSMKGVGKYKVYLKNAYKIIGDNNYTTKSEFVAHVIDPAIEEINKYTDLCVSYDFVKEFGVPEQIVFDLGGSKGCTIKQKTKVKTMPSKTPNKVSKVKSTTDEIDDPNLIPLSHAEAKHFVDDEFLETAKEFSDN